MAYNRLDPIGEWRADARNSQLLAVITNLFIKRFGKKGSKEAAPIDFMPQWDKEEAQKAKHQSVDEMKQKIMSIGEVFKSKKQKESK